MCKQYRTVTLKQAHLSALGSCLMGQVNNEAALWFKETGASPHCPSMVAGIG